MSDPLLSDDVPLPLDARRRIAEDCARFDKAVRDGLGPRIEDHIPPNVAPGERRELLKALLEVEFYYRQQTSQAVDLGEYLLRFPVHADVVREASLGLIAPATPGLANSPTEPVLAPGPGGEPPTASRSPQVAAEADLFAGRLPCPFGRYLVRRQLGKGGMGAVYLAHDTTLDRAVALKVARFPAGEEATAERFLREARAAADLPHEGVCRVLDCGVIDGAYYITMDYIEGQSLAQRLATHKAQDQRWAAELVRRVAIALEAVHERGIVHRDLKPGNIMLRAGDMPCVVDFGLARRDQDGTITRAGSMVGTPAYMSPEQIEGGLITQATDVYSLGVILYQLLTGRLPFTGDHLIQVTYKIVNGESLPPSRYRPDLDPALEEICLRAMARSVKERCPTMAALAEALSEYLSGPAARSGTVRPPAPRRPRRKRRNRLAAALRGRWWLVFFSLVVSVGLAAGVRTIMHWYGAHPPDPSFVGTGPDDEDFFNRRLTGLKDATPCLGINYDERKRFGLVLLTERDPNNPAKFKRLTYEEKGSTNNTCVRVDGHEYLFGNPGHGKWLIKERGRKNGRVGWDNVFEFTGEGIVVTQSVDLVPGDQTQLLDTVVVRYKVENQSKNPHTVGLRVMLDTFIGANDGAPFAVPGSEGKKDRLVDTMETFDQKDIPDYIQALERPALNNPGTVAHIGLNLPNYEPLDRMIICHWPGNKEIKWDIEPVESMQTDAGKPDSCVVLYWPYQMMNDGEVRKMAFTYGLNAISGASGGGGDGKIALTTGGSTRPGREFTVTSYVKEPREGQVVKLILPAGFDFAKGHGAEKRVERVHGNLAQVSWRVRTASKEGDYVLEAVSGATRTTLTLRLRDAGLH
jgi:predicted Ser/Thr protein kinase